MKHDVTDAVVIPNAWECTLRVGDLHGRGNAELLSCSLTAFFASRVCPASAIRAGLAWALEQAHAGATVIGGFHSPLERSVLNMLLEGRSPAVAVLARNVQSARLPASWQTAIGRGHFAVVSQSDDRCRLDRDHSASRNELVAGLADRIVVGYASPVGNLAGQVTEWQRCGKSIRLLRNAPMFDDTQSGVDSVR